MTLPGTGEVTLVNVHLMLAALRFNILDGSTRNLIIRANEARVGQYPKLAALVRAHAGETPVIVAGDFNTPGGARSMRPLGAAGLRDIWLEAGRGPAKTITNSFPVSRIDQMWVSADIRAEAAWTSAPAISDHRPVIADLVVGDGPAH